jgi:putative CRISPR-associated protein (TIGR02619 family)
MADGKESIVDFRCLDHHNAYSHLPSACVTALKYHGSLESPARLMVNHTDMDCVLAGLTLMGLLPLDVLEKLNPEVGLLDTEPLGADHAQLTCGDLIRLWKSGMASARQSGWSWLYGLQLFIDIHYNYDYYDKIRIKLLEQERERVRLAHEDYEQAARGASGKVLVVSPSRVHGFDVQFHRQPDFPADSLEGWRHWCIAAHVAEAGNVTLSCPGKNVAELAFGPGGLLNVYPKLPVIEGKDWGGRESVGGSPRGVAVQAEMLGEVLAVVENLLNGGIVMQRCVVSTCGTSILTNLENSLKRNNTEEIQNQIALELQKESLPPLFSLNLNVLSNKRETELDSNEKGYLDCLLKHLVKKANAWDIKGARNNSAELNALLAYYGNKPSSGQGDIHYFVHSDTYVGKECANVIAAWWKNQGRNFNAALQAIGGLNTASYYSFRDAMSELARWCHNDISPMRNPPHNIVAFNLTGGFKSVQGFMQTLGMLYADETFYLFQGADELMMIPRLPFDVNSSAQQEIERHFDVYRELSINISIDSSDTSKISGIPESMLFTDGVSGYTLSVWGEIFWNKYKTELYKQRLYESPSPRIILTRGFCDEIERLGMPHIFSTVNERIDDLVQYWLSNGQRSINRLDYKRLAGQRNGVRPECTHEFDLWADGPHGTARGCCHVINGQLSVDQVFYPYN